MKSSALLRRQKIPNLGIGVGLRFAHYEEILATRPSIDWFEIITELLMRAAGQSREQLEEIASMYPVALHGVTLSIGSADPLDFEYLKKLKEIVRKFHVPWVSDHLSWGRLEGAHYHDLLPLPYRADVVDYVSERARIVQDFLEIPFALENVSSYAAHKANEMPEWEFYSAVVEKADVFMMLDVNNIYVSSRNYGFSPSDFYKNLPLERVLQIHLAGHTDYDSYCIDTHDDRVCDEVWKIYAEVYPFTNNASTLLEWDDQFLSFEDTWKEALKAKEFQKEISKAF